MTFTSVIIGGDGEPQEPEWRLIYSDADDLEAAHAHWGNIIREMKERQTLSVANGHAIRRLVDFRLIYERALRHVSEHGAVLKPKDKSNKAGLRNPYWITMRNADEAIRYLETELGISPLRRNRAGKVQKRDRAARASDAYLKPVKG